jgi:hypothetical protein
MDAFRIDAGKFDTTKAYKFIREKQAKLLNKSKEEKYQEAIRLFQQHTSSKIVKGKWKHDWYFMIEGVTGLKEKVKCCMRTFAELHGFTQYSFEIISKTLKAVALSHPDEIVPSQKRVLGNVQYKPLLDHHIHGKNFNDVRDIFEKHCSEEAIPETMIRAALTPSNARINSISIVDHNQLAVVWLEEYVDHFADVSPNSEFKKLNVTFLSEIYATYKSSEGIKKSGKFVSYNTFLELWSIIFPYATKRPWCNIPGKCETCYQIDKARRNTTDYKIQKMLQELHTIHRGV